MKFDSEFQKVPYQLPDEDNLQLIGKITHHRCIQFEIFPIRLSKAILKQYLFSDVSNEELIQSFLEF